jgi:hypothetical protein
MKNKIRLDLALTYWVKVDEEQERVMTLEELTALQESNLALDAEQRKSIKVRRDGTIRFSEPIKQIAKWDDAFEPAEEVDTKVMNRPMREIMGMLMTDDISDALFDKECEDMDNQEAAHIANGSKPTSTGWTPEKRWREFAKVVRNMDVEVEQTLIHVGQTRPNGTTPYTLSQYYTEIKPV